MTTSNRIEPITHCWPLPPDMLVCAVTEAGETCVTLTGTTRATIDGPGAALVELVKGLSTAKLHLSAAERR